MGAARRLTLTSALWTPEFRTKPVIEKIVAGKGAKAALLAYDCFNKQKIDSNILVF
jgi:hypothetical protein